MKKLCQHEFESSQGEIFNLMVDKLLNKGDELILPEKTSGMS